MKNKIKAKLMFLFSPWGLLPFLFFSCNYNRNDNYYIKDSKIQGYINMDSSIHLMDTNCLKNLMNSLNGVIWDKSKQRLFYGFFYTPSSFQYKDTTISHQNNLDKFFVVKKEEIEKNDTLCWILGFHFSYVDQAFYPCKFQENNNIVIYNTILINPIPKYLRDNNCFRNFNVDTNYQGVFKLLHPDSNELENLRQ